MGRCLIALMLTAGCSFHPGSLGTGGGISDASTQDAIDAVRSTTDARGCDTSWPNAFAVSRYYVGSNMNYDDSQAYCESQGARLAIIETAPENAAVAALLATAGADSWTWIGLSDRGTEGTDVWVDGVTVGGGDYTNYNPKIGDAADCYDFSRDPGGGKWGDWYCTNVHSFICECDEGRAFP